MDELGTLVEGGGSGQYEEVYGPGSIIPDYVLDDPAGLTILATSRTVSSPTQLNKLLRPGQGRVHWAACRSLVNHRDTGGNGATIDRWLEAHRSRVRASDFRFDRGWSGWGADSVPILGDRQAVKLHGMGGAYWIGEPVILMPGV